MFQSGDRVVVSMCQGPVEMTLLRRLTTQDEVDFLENLGTPLAPDFEFREVVPDDGEWLARDDEGQEWPVCFDGEHGWIS